MRSRVIVVDYECMTPLGATFEESWLGLESGRSGVGWLPPELATSVEFAARFTSPLGTMLGAEVDMISWPEPAFHCAGEVVGRIGVRTGLDSGEHEAERIGMIGSTTLTSHVTLHAMQSQSDHIKKTRFMLNQCHNMPLSEAGRRIGARGPSFVVNGACASSAHAILVASRLISCGTLDCAIVVGYEFPLAPACINGLDWMRALYRRTDKEDRAYSHPEAASRPFSIDRRGFILAEGVGAVLLADEEYAARHSWPIRAAVEGVYANSDASHLTRNSPQSMVRCMQGALSDAGVAPEEIGSVSAHANSTGLGDAAELQALLDVFGKTRLPRLPIAAPKSQLGHSLGAAAVLNLIFSTEAMLRGMVLPTLNHRADPDLPEAWIEGTTRRHDYSRFLVNAFGFGGTNSSLVVSAP